MGAIIKAIKAKIGDHDAAFAYWPAVIIGLAVLWDWVARLNSFGWDWDITHYMYYGQRLTQGELLWTSEFGDKLLALQFLFWLPATLDSFRVWQLMSMGACVAGGYAVYTILRDVFSSATRLPRRSGHYAGLYGGVATLYLFSVLPGGIDHINALPISMALVAAALARRAFQDSGEGVKTVSMFLASCFCASLAAGLRPYLVVLLGLVPIWVSIVARLESRTGKPGYIAIAKFFILWNACVASFTLLVNVLPYTVIGEWDAFIAGIGMLTQDITKPMGAIDTLAMQAAIFSRMDPIAAMLSLSWLVFSMFLLTRCVAASSRAGLLPQSAAFQLFALSIIGPLSIQLMIFTKHFWHHYFQFFAPFIAIGAVALYVMMVNAKPAGLYFLLRHKPAFVLATIVLVSGPVSGLQTKIRSTVHKSEPKVASIVTLLDKHGGGNHHFLAPYNMYVHWRFFQHRLGFPNAANTGHITIQNWWQKANIPHRLNLPKNTAEYCRMLDARGPQLIVFFENQPLVHCDLRQYDFYDLSAAASLRSDVAYYFIRREPTRQ